MRKWVGKFFYVIVSVYFRVLKNSHFLICRLIQKDLGVIQYIKGLVALHIPNYHFKEIRRLP